MKKLILSALLFSVSFSFSSWGLTSAAFADSNSVSIRAVTYNTWMIPFLRKDAKERANIIGHGLGEKGYDLIMLQEMFSKRLRKIVRKNYALSKQGLFGFRLPAIINSGLVTMGSYPVVKFDFKRYWACGGWQCLSSKGIQFSRVEIKKGLYVDVYNTHLQPYESGHRIRREQIAEIRRFMSKNSNQGHPVIVAGDFNIISEAPEYETLRSQFSDFRGVWAEANPNSPGYSWNPDENPYTEPDRGTDYINQKVDYLFVRDGDNWFWEVEKAQLDFTRPLPYQGKEYFGSDHFAVGAELRLVRDR